jgi:phage terminase small subunit
MPRKSAASLSLVSALDGRRSRLRPPPTLSEPERTQFIDVVSSCKPEHFQTSDIPLLLRYCECAVLAQQAATQLRIEGAVVGGRVNPWAVIQEKSIRGLVSLSMRLRLSPQARAANNPSRPQPHQVSHYEKMALGNSDPEA